VLAEAGKSDLSSYSGTPDAELSLDIFVDGWPVDSGAARSTSL
jgi:hypothetical protein